MMAKTAYLTIDDGPSPDFLNKLDFLDAHGIRAIWFCQGNMMEQRPEMMVEAIRRGHIIGNHAYSHPHFSEISVDQAYAEIRATDAVIEELYRQTGVARTHRFFRFPYGDKGDGEHDDISEKPDAAGRAQRDAIQQYLRKLAYTQPAFPGITYRYFYDAGLSSDADCYWTYDTHDWAILRQPPPHGIDSLEKMFQRMEEDAPEEGRGLNYPDSAEIILMHDNHRLPSEIFTRLIDRLLEKGLHFEMPL